VLGVFNQGTSISSSLGNFAIDYAGGLDGYDVVLTRIPEPGTLALALAALALGLRRRRA
jgi:hypothetical protein